MIPWPDIYLTPLSELRGLSLPRFKSLAKRGISTFVDLLSIPPLRYQDRREISPLSSAREGESLMFLGIVVQTFEGVSKTGKPYFRVRVEDTSDRGAKATLWYFQGINFTKRAFTVGKTFAITGTPTFFQSFKGKFAPEASFTHPDTFNLEFNSLETILGVHPIYGPIKALSPGSRRVIIKEIFDRTSSAPKILPDLFLEKNKLKDPTELLKIIHDPPNVKGTLPLPRESRAFRTLSLLEMTFWRVLALEEKAKRILNTITRPAPPQLNLGDEFVKLLPFQLSPEQTRVLTEIREGLSQSFPTNILVQGEVGSGKTAVAAALLFQTVGQGRQAVLVAPTELLARQHHAFLLPYTEKLKIPIAFLTGTTPAAEKRKLLGAISRGIINLVVGTQALFSPKVVFNNLSLAVIDEQHRFGVRQRLFLREKNPLVDLISMSATPIPRSLAQVIYGDMDIASIKGTLPGRKTPQTLLFPKDERDRAYQLFGELIQSGEQGFLISPRIGIEEEEEDLEINDPDSPEKPKRGPSIPEMEQKLKSFFPNLNLGVIHGKIESQSRQGIMEDFRQRRLEVLLSTTIVEVGVDIPGANIMMIEGAENLGLAQLHQLRGRIGRGGGNATLILLAHGELTENASSRFEALKSGDDGYALAELDLQLRGPGEEMGLKQSGWPKFSFVKFPKDLNLLPAALKCAESLLEMKDQFSPALKNGLERLNQNLINETLGI
ncbi:MAG: DEAD/DEAH box helicase [Deltaproteobacteria bacterium]|jgi:ATP-dependent DNA helicase RecG|nr:DEAD/DEAH box helicase [Deltaproteobacteria bacterium]